MNVAKLSREDARHEVTTPSGTRAGGIEAVGRWFAISVALALAVSFGIWLQK